MWMDESGKGSRGVVVSTVQNTTGGVGNIWRSLDYGPPPCQSCGCHSSILSGRRAGVRELLVNDMYITPWPTKL